MGEYCFYRVFLLLHIIVVMSSNRGRGVFGTHYTRNVFQASAIPLILSGEL